MKNLQDKCRGSLIGGAVGDALGYAVEFDSLQRILRKYGESGISEYELEDGVAVFSDDTQMSLFTAAGLLAGSARDNDDTDLLLAEIKVAYLDWYVTQTMQRTATKRGWLMHIGRLWQRRAPGNTCLSSLSMLAKDSSQQVVNDSKGCGGVMRVAPIGIYAAVHSDKMDLLKCGLLAGAAAELTHGHPLSTFASMAFAMIVSECILEENIDQQQFRYIVIERVFNLLQNHFAGSKDLLLLKTQIVNALELAVSDICDADCIRRLGEGWVGDEALAIALFSVMRYINDFSKCIVCAVNHDGDSDSTGAIAGNIIGAILGYNMIPERFLKDLELKDLLLSMADDLCGKSVTGQFKARYIDGLPVGVPAELLIP